MESPRLSTSVIVIGDTHVGKTSLIHRLTHQFFKEDYTPTSFDKVLSTHRVNKYTVDFVLWDTSGSSAYDNVRSLSYQEADVFLLCFSVSDPVSLYNVKSKWIQDIRKHCPDAPVILCGCQSDLRTDPATISRLGKIGRTPVSSEQALAICCDIEAINYVETSAKGLDKDVFEALEVCAFAKIERGSVHSRSFLGSLECVKKSSLSSLTSKKVCNVSFSGSECDIQPIIEEDDVFVNGHSTGCLPSLSSRRGASQNTITAVVQRNDSAVVKTPRPLTLFSPTNSEPPMSAIVRPNGLSRRTSFRSERTASIPVSSPKSPLLSEHLKDPPLHYNCKSSSFSKLSTEFEASSPQSVVALKKTYESLKSHTSMASQGSTGSKSSTESSSSTITSAPPDNPELLKELNFISPKAGVFRPLPNRHSRKKKHNCSVM